MLYSAVMNCEELKFDQICRDLEPEEDSEAWLMNEEVLLADLTKLVTLGRFCFLR